jgi:hypothetical protein
MPEVEIPNPEHAHHTAADPFALRVALVVAGYAVLLALATYLLHRAEHELLLDQQQITDQWNFYQAKAIREAIYSVEVEKLETELERLDLSVEPRVRMKQQHDRLKQKLAKYENEKEDIKKKAERLEEEVKKMERRSPCYGFAEILLQIAIVLASVSILSKNVPVFWCSVGAAGLAVLLILNGLFLLVPILG